MKPDPKPVKVEKHKMTSAEFRAKYGSYLKTTKTKKPKRAKSDRQKLIAKADQWFSRRIRLEDADSHGMGRCIDCGAVVHIKKSDCGHFWSRRHLATRWDTDNCHLQKKKCNLEMGRPETNDGYRKNLIKKIGQANFDKLEMRKNNTWKPSEFDLQTIIDENMIRTSYLLHKLDLQKWW